MKNYQINPFATEKEAVRYFMSCGLSAGEIEGLKSNLRTLGYCRYKSYHIVIDPNHLIEPTRKSNYRKPLLGLSAVISLFVAIGYVGAENILGAVVCLTLFGLCSWKGGFMKGTY